MGATIGNVGIVKSGLQLWLDAGVKSSYSGTGLIWYDISGNNKHFNINASPTFTSLGNQSYFTLNGSSQDFSGTVRSNQFNLSTSTNAALTIEIGILPTTSQNTAFTWAGSDNAGQWAIHAHTPESALVRFDTIARATYRLDVSYNPQNILNTFTFVVRSDTFRAVYRNGVSIATSTVSATGWNFGTATPRIGSQASTGGADYFVGRYYFFRLYNRGLTDAEIIQNYNTNKIKLGL